MIDARSVWSSKKVRLMRRSTHRPAAQVACHDLFGPMRPGPAESVSVWENQAACQTRNDTATKPADPGIDPGGSRRADRRFYRARAQRPSEIAVPGAHLLLGVVYGKDGQELARVAPRMVSVNNSQGY